MNAILGMRIRFLRESKGFTQEQIAEKIKCSRQKYARLEKGLIDISYANLMTVAHVLGIKVEDITSSVNNISQEQPMFRANNESIQEDEFEYINKMIDTFYAHRKLYQSVRQVNVDE